jgi:hypothetical protein
MTTMLDSPNRTPGTGTGIGRDASTTDRTSASAKSKPVKQIRLIFVEFSEIMTLQFSFLLFPFFIQ